MTVHTHICYPSDPFTSDEKRTRAHTHTHTQTHARIEMERNFLIREVTVIRLSCKYIISINSTRPFINLTHNVLDKLRFHISGNRINCKGKGKGAPITGHEGPEGE